MDFYLAMVGFEPTPTATAAPSNTETTVIPSRPLYIYIFRGRYGAIHQTKIPFVALDPVRDTIIYIYIYI